MGTEYDLSSYIKGASRSKEIPCFGALPEAPNLFCQFIVASGGGVTAVTIRGRPGGMEHIKTLDLSMRFSQPTQTIKNYLFYTIKT